MKLVIDEPESAALERHLPDSPLLASSRIAVVEVTRATRLANPSPEARAATECGMVVATPGGATSGS